MEIVTKDLIIDYYNNSEDYKYLENIHCQSYNEICLNNNIQKDAKDVIFNDEHKFYFYLFTDDDDNILHCEYVFGEGGGGADNYYAILYFVTENVTPHVTDDDYINLDDTIYQYGRYYEISNKIYVALNTFKIILYSIYRYY